MLENFHNRILQKGISMIECLISISVLFILLVISTPSLTGNLARQHQQEFVVLLRRQLQMARVHAIMQATSVILCHSRDQRHCAADAQWQQGWIIFADQNHNFQRDSGEPLIAEQQRFTHLDKVLFRAFGHRQLVQFEQRGYAYSNGSFIVCSGGSVQTSQKIIISMTGRIRVNMRLTEKEKALCRA